MSGTIVQCHVCKQILRGSICTNQKCPAFDGDHSLLMEIDTLNAENEKLLAQRYELGRFISQIRDIIILITMRGDITLTFNSTLKEVSVAIFDICNDALAKLKESGGGFVDTR